MGILTRLIEVPDLHNYRPEFYPDGTEKHVFCDGARYHVLSYSGLRMRCSASKCEYNLPDDKRIALMVEDVAAKLDAEKQQQQKAPKARTRGVNGSNHG